MMEAVDNFRIALKSLMNINIFSLNAIAKEAGLNAAAVSRYLAGEKALGEKNRRRLLRALGLNVDTKLLDPTKVHVWFVGNQLADLQRVLREFTDGDGLLLRKVQVVGRAISHPEVAADEDTFLVSADNLSAVIVRSLKDSDPKAVPLNPSEFGEGMKWWISKDGGVEEASVDEEEWRTWLNGKVTEEQFWAAMGRSAIYTWTDIRNLAQQTGTSVQFLVGYLRSIAAKQLLESLSNSKDFFSGIDKRE